MTYETVIDLAGPLATEPEAVVVPPAIRQAYGIAESADITVLSGGLVNQTLLVHQLGRTTVLQKAAPVLVPGVVADAAVVGGHLNAHGWEAPLPLPTRDGDLHAIDRDGTMWRHQTYIESDGNTPIVYTPELFAAAGDMLGRWHHTVASLDYTPRFELPHLHDTPHHAAKLGNYLLSLPDSEVRDLAQASLEAYRLGPGLPAGDSQLIHGDPKLDNMLFRGGKPFTLIDFDTLMRDSPWVDVGDLLRSAIGKHLSGGQAVNEATILPFVESYQQALALRGSADQTFAQAMTATNRIAAELAMRYLCDIHEASYFNWDHERHSSRRDNHYERAQLQLSVAALAIELTN